MPGALLRSGKLEEFKALGEDGQPVYTSALQLREAIRLKLGRDAAHCLAIPQRNETGDQIDWYAPEEGDVVPWSAATDEERVAAKAALESMHAKLLGVGNKMRDEENRERQIFGRLLGKVIFFPDDSHVYLVNGKPVLTFWGFTDPKGSSIEDPLGRLHARTPVAARPETTPPATPEPELPPVVPAVPKKRFSWWWLLLIPLLLLLLFFLLRACAPEVPLPFMTPDSNQPEAQHLQPPDVMPDGGHYDVNGTGDGGGAGGEAPESENPTPPAGAEEPGAENPGAEPPAEEAPAESPTDEQPPEEQQPEQQTPPDQGEPAPEDQQNDQQPPQEQPQPENPKPQPSGQQNPDQPGQPPKPMEIPPDAMQKGSTDFLNGKWKAGAGIQDARTGKPMRLDYDFKDGKGKVRVSGGNGVECVGDVNAAVGGSGVTINSQGQAKCNDGSSYKLPDVHCKPGATSAADCTGAYENNKQFPMSIKKDN